MKIGQITSAPYKLVTLEEAAHGFAYFFHIEAQGTWPVCFSLSNLLNY